jgi:hypothetical protein
MQVLLKPFGHYVSQTRWGVGSLVYLIAGGRRRSSPPDDSAPSTG